MAGDGIKDPCLQYQVVSVSFNNYYILPIEKMNNAGLITNTGAIASVALSF